MKIIYQFILIFLFSSFSLCQTIPRNGVSILNGGILYGGYNSPVANLSTSSIDFGIEQQTSGGVQLYRVQNITLTNTGTATLTISSIGLSGTDSADFSESDTCGGSVTVGNHCIISILFSPTCGGTCSTNTAESATLSINDNAANSPQTISLAGTGSKNTSLFTDSSSNTGTFGSWTWQVIGANQSVVSSPIVVGSHSLQFTYQYTTSTPPTDQNVYAGAIFTNPSASTIYYGGYQYIKSPESDETPDIYVGRKLIWFSDSTSSGNNLGNYQIILSCYVSGGITICPVTWGHQPTGGCAPSTGSEYLSYQFNYNSWDRIVWEIVLNTPGISDGELHLFINGSDVADSTGLNLRGTCTNNLTQLGIGEQANITVSGTVHELRFHAGSTVTTTDPGGK